MALGAFIAGLLISESEYSHQALAEVLPFRNSFNSLFFVSIGMLMDLRIILEHPISLVLLVSAVLIGKFLTAVSAVLWSGAPLRSAILSGMALSQVGEFAFILAQEGQKFGLLTQEAYKIFLALSVLTMVITPFLIQWSPQIARRTEALQRLRSLWPERTTSREEISPFSLKDHVVIVGYGLNGRNLARVLREVEIPYIVLDIRGELVQMEMGRPVPILYGDATNPTVLHKVHIERARILVVATSDRYGARRIVSAARELHPGLHIVVRTRYLDELEELQNLGANEVVPEEFETSIEIFTLVLQSYKLPKDVILEKAENIRREGYASLRRGELPELAHHLRAGTLLDVEVETCSVSPDSPAVGISLSQLALRKKTGASVIALTRAGKTQSSPSPATSLQPGDMIVLLGSRSQIQRAISYLLDTQEDREQ